MPNYEMRIANRGTKNKNGCYPFSEEVFIFYTLKMVIIASQLMGCASVITDSLQIQIQHIIFFSITYENIKRRKI